MAIRTVFSTVEGCSRGDYAAWCDFVRDYAPIARNLLEHYFPTLAPDVEQAILSVFAKAHADENAWFRSLRFANEREFAMAFRDLVFAHGRTEARIPSPGIPAEDVFSLLNGLTLIQRQLFWVFLKGWDVEQASAMLMNASATATETSSIAQERLRSLRPEAAVERTGVALVAIEAAQSRRCADCLPWKTFNNVINGQISWNDREAAERHMADCVHCLDAFTAFQEMIWLRKIVAPLGPQECETLVRRLKIDGPAAKGLLGRFLSRAS